MTNILDSSREQIDKIDREILKLFIRRMELVGDIALYKKDLGIDIYNAEREKEILKFIKENSGEYGKYSFKLFETVLLISREYQSERINEK